jgi:predicted peroxiredoxin
MSDMMKKKNGWEKVEINEELNKILKEIAKKENVSYENVLNFIISLGISRYIELSALPQLKEFIREQLKKGKNIAVFEFSVKLKKEEDNKSYV